MLKSFLANAEMLVVVADCWRGLSLCAHLNLTIDSSMYFDLASAIKSDWHLGSPDMAGFGLTFIIVQVHYRTDLSLISHFSVFLTAFE